MKIHTANFKFYDFVDLKISSPKHQYIDYIQREFAPLLTQEHSELAHSQINVSIDLPENHKEMSEKLSFNHRFRKLFHVRYSVSDYKNNPTQLNFWGDKTIHLYTPVMGTFLQTSFIEPLIYSKCLIANAVLLHASCISNGEQAYLFVASSGSGKTTTALRLANKGFKFLGDDLIFVTDKGLALPYPRPLHLFSYVIKGLPFLHISSKLKYTLLWKDIVRAIVSRLTGERFFIATRVAPTEVMPQLKVGKSVPLKKIFFLTNQEDSKLRQLDTIDYIETAKRISSVGDINKVLFENILASDPEYVSFLRERETEIIENTLHNVSEIYEMNPRAFDDSDWQMLIDLLR